MRLTTLSAVCVASSMLGLLALIAASFLAYDRMQAKQAKVADLLALKQEIGDFSVAADHMMLFPTGPDLTAAVREQGRAIQRRLRPMADDHPSAGNAIEIVDLMLAQLPPPTANGEAGARDRATGTGLGPLNLAPRSQALLSQMANHGIALEIAADQVFRGRQRAIARQATWLAAGFAAAALLFATMSAAGFARVYKRIGVPVRELSRTIEQVEAGDRTARAPEGAHDELGELAAAFNRMRDRQEVTRKQLEVSRTDLEAALASRSALLDALPAHIALLDNDGTILDVNAQWCDYGRDNAYRGEEFGKGRNYLNVCDTATGTDAEHGHAAARGIRSILSGERAQFVYEYPCHAPGRRQWFRLMVNRLPAPAGEPRQNRAVAMHIDITERKLGEYEIERAAYEDRLTGLWSRTGFARALTRRLDSDGDHPASMVVMLDVVALRDVNEAHGYDVADNLLVEIGDRLRESLGDATLIGRIGGDEFGVFVPVSHDQGPADQRARIASVFARPFDLDGQAVQIGARFGYTRVGRGARDGNDLMRKAELALFQSPDGAWTQFTHDMDRRARARIQLTRELRQAVERNEFQLHYQPKVDMPSGRMMACEALIRWDHPERGLLAPGQFMPTAEQSQLIGPIGDWVIHEACRRVRQWHAEHLDVVRVAVNVSLVQFRLGDFPERVRQALAATGAAPGDLTLEITESVFEQASDTLQRQLADMHDMGIRLALDDFGTGYSSLLYLQRYPFDEIKIDKGFVQRMLHEPYSREIVRTVLGIAHVTGAEVIAEGIESSAERDALVAMGCRIGQGFHYSMPMAEEDFTWLLETRTRLPLTEDT
jgi:diguanylate cyclase (GGDEF)-like protein